MLQIESSIRLRRRALIGCGAIVVAGLESTIVGSAAVVADRQIKWVIYYGQTADEHVLSRYDIVILDPGFQGSVSAVARGGARVVGYLSLGEISVTNPFYAEVDRAVLLDENPDWPGTFRVDVRQASWRKLVLDRIIPHIRSLNYSGLLYDTLDTPPYLEQCDPINRRGMTEAAVELVQAIRRTNPDLMAIMNRGYVLLPRVLNCIDAVLAESLLTRSDPQRPGTYQWNDAAEVELQMSLLAPAIQRHPRLPVLSLDYWKLSNLPEIRRIYAVERQLGFHPYVSTPTLDQIVAEPGSADRGSDDDLME